MAVRLEVGQIWEEVDARRSVKRRFIIAGFRGPLGPAVGCVRFYGMNGDDLAANPKTGRKPCRFFLSENELDGKRFSFTGETTSISTTLPPISNSKSYGL